MRDKFLKALDKISDHLLTIDDSEFDRIIDEHKNGKYAKVLKDMGHVFSDTFYETLTNNYIEIEYSKEVPQFLENDSSYSNESEFTISVDSNNNIILDNKWTQLAA